MVDNKDDEAVYWLGGQIFHAVIPQPEADPAAQKAQEEVMSASGDCVTHQVLKWPGLLAVCPENTHLDLLQGKDLIKL